MFDCSEVSPLVAWNPTREESLLALGYHDFLRFLGHEFNSKAWLHTLFPHPTGHIAWNRKGASIARYQPPPYSQGNPNFTKRRVDWPADH